ncbi:hypothetical protein BCR39DRAFT_593571 [Naematelia encephala]|uniref:Beta-glucuronidase C-terminal domain-containing protein n=1 Tax=Naematelia encephala TaxID=71784 RepID=A0A1Y2B8E1_9TREE|nr:hypothetical protein BCR39DRAFT_593571 [Naematelia encephala]
MRPPHDTATSAIGSGVSVTSSTAPSATNMSLVLPAEQPCYAQPLSPNLAAFSIEMDHWRDWAGQEVGQPNTYVNQLLNNLARGTGRSPSFRVGADSEDRGTVDLSVQVENSTFPNVTATVPYPEATLDLIGEDFYALSANLPPGTRFTWGINLKYLNVTETVRQATLLADTFQGSRASLLSQQVLETVEIGNEPDFYSFPGWTPLNYTTTWIEYAKAVADVLDFSSDKNGTTLFAGAFSGLSPYTWNARAALEAGILNDPELSKYTKTFAEHNYDGVYGYPGYGEPMPGGLMDKANVRGNLTIKLPDIMATHAAGLAYVIGEGNSYANHGAPNVSNTAEAAIWGVDHLLYGASLGIERLYFHHGVGYRYNLFQPVAGVDDGTNTTSRPHILPAYYGFLITNEAIGSSGNSYVAEIQTTNQSIAAYGIWEGGKLVQAVVINNTPYYDITTRRPSFDVAMDGFSGGSATVKRLSVPYTTAFHGLTWGNQTFDTVSGVPEGTVYEEDLPRTGVLSIDASSVALVCFK